MFDLKAFAKRNGDSIDVTLHGSLSDTCHSAVIKDFYPGGDIVYVRDPGEAQIFIAETVNSGNMLCLTVLVPWSATITIKDSEHDEVGIYVNGKKMLVVDITTNSKDEYNVYHFAHGFVPGKTCVILPQGFTLDYPYEKVYGPSNYKDCEEWIKENAFFLHNGGSGAPRGILQKIDG